MVSTPGYKIEKINQAGDLNTTVYYIGFYSYPDPILLSQQRSFSAAAVNMMNYLLGVLRKEHRVEIYAPAWTQKNKGSYAALHIQAGESVNLHLPPTLGRGNPVARAVSMMLAQGWLFYKIFKNIRRNDRVLVYHSIANSFVVLFTKALLKYQLVLQVNEIYQNVSSIGKINSYLEHKIINAGDSYIFATRLLNKKIKTGSRSYLVCEGVLSMNPVLAQRVNDGKIHLVYAGLIDKIKLCAFIAADLGEYLPGSYVIHIAGFGTETDIQDLLKRVDEVNSKGKCNIVYEGFLQGDALFKLLQSCHLGLVTQANDQEFTNTSFPSKIYTYLTNYLPVISLVNESILASPVADLLHLYKDNNPAHIAAMIQAINFSETSNESVQREMGKIHEQFSNGLLKMLA